MRYAKIARAGRPAASKHRDARELLLNVATELFAAHGVAATTFVMIAKQSRFTPAVLHYYFESRDQLLDAVVDERFLRFLSHVWDPVRPDVDPLVAIPELVARLLDSIEKMPWVPSLWVREVLNEGGLLRERVQGRLPYERVKWLGSAIAGGQANGTLNPDLNPLLTVSSAVGLVMLHMATIKPWAKLFHREPMARQTLQRHITGLLLDGLRCKGKVEIKATSTKKIHRMQKRK
jgi:TetR/AcrR family transcriptional regulator